MKKTSYFSNGKIYISFSSYTESCLTLKGFIENNLLSNNGKKESRERAPRPAGERDRGRLRTRVGGSREMIAS